MERSFTQRLKRLGYTKKRLSEELGVSQEQVSRWAESPPRYATAYLDRVDELAEAKGVAEKTAAFIESLKE